MQKPEVGDFYKAKCLEIFVFNNVIEILRIEGNLAFYRFVNDFTFMGYKRTWNFVKYPDGIRKLTPLEIELL